MKMHRQGKCRLLVMADLHLREDQPVSRVDNYWEAQENKLRFLRSYWLALGAPQVLIAGDVFDHWKPSPRVLSLAIRFLPKSIIAVAGQHDLPEHSLKQWKKSGLQTLIEAGTVSATSEAFHQAHPHVRIFCKSYGQEYPDGPDTNRFSILLTHQMVTFSEDPILGGSTSRALLREHPYNLIVSGDNHKTHFFSLVENDSIANSLINCGSMMRMNADQISHKPAFYDVMINTMERRCVWKTIRFPVEQNVLSRKHITRVKMRDKQIDLFVSSLKKSYDVGLSFKDNLEAFLRNNKVDEEVQQWIRKATE